MPFQHVANIFELCTNTYARFNIVDLNVASKMFICLYIVQIFLVLALYMCINNEQNGKERSEMSEDTGQIPITASPQVGVSYELCAGIVDKKKSLAEIAKEEVLEETGYAVSVENLEPIFSTRSVGSSGNQVTIFYAEVTDEMKVGQGGGAPDEDEEIDVEHLPVEKAKDLVFDSSKAKPASLVAAFMWYFWKNKLS